MSIGAPASEMGGLIIDCDTATGEVMRVTNGVSLGVDRFGSAFAP